MWTYDRGLANTALGEILTRMSSAEGYELLEAPEFQNGLVEAALKDKVPVLIPVTPRHFS